MEYVVRIDGVFHGKNRTMPSLNEYISECNRNPKAGGRMKRNFMNICSLYIRKCLGIVHIDKQVDLEYEFYETDTKRDKGNIASFAQKCFEDSLQECGVLKNDGWKEIRNFKFSFFVDKEHPRIIVTIREVED